MTAAPQLGATQKMTGGTRRAAFPSHWPGRFSARGCASPAPSEACGAGAGTVPADCAGRVGTRRPARCGPLSLVPRSRMAVCSSGDSSAMFSRPRASDVSLGAARPRACIFTRARRSPDRNYSSPAKLSVRASAPLAPEPLLACCSRSTARAARPAERRGRCGAAPGRHPPLPQPRHPPVTRIGNRRPTAGHRQGT